MICSLTFAIFLVFHVRLSLSFFNFPLTNTITYGNRTYPDELLLRRSVFAQKNSNSYTTHEEMFHLPADCHYITQIVVKDQKSRAPYGISRIVNGGLGEHNVTLEFLSDINQDVCSTVKLYGI